MSINNSSKFYAARCAACLDENVSTNLKTAKRQDILEIYQILLSFNLNVSYNSII